MFGHFSTLWNKWVKLIILVQHGVNTNFAFFVQLFRNLYFVSYNHIIMKESIHIYICIFQMSWPKLHSFLRRYRLHHLSPTFGLPPCAFHFVENSTLWKFSLHCVYILRTACNILTKLWTFDPSLIETFWHVT